MSVKKEPLRDIREIFKPDGKLNVLTGMQGMQHFLGQHAAGHVDVKDGHVDVGAPDSDGYEEVTIKFKRKH